MDIITYNPQTLNVKIIPLGVSITDIDQNELAGRLNGIYNRYGINWTLTVDNEFNKSNELGGKATEIQQIIPNYQLIAGDEFFSEYSSPQNDLNALYKSYLTEKGSYNNETVYLFVLPTAPQGAERTTGDMPIGKQWGYLFGSAVDARTLAHELGHGKLELRHTFASEACGSGKQGQSNNLMDYPATGSSPLGGGREGASDSLVCQQWNYMHDPALIGKVFQDDGDGALLSLGVMNELANMRFRYKNSMKYLISNKCAGSLSKGDRFFNYTIKDNVVMNLGAKMDFNLSFKKSQSEPFNNGKILYKIEIENNIYIYCSSENDRDVIYNFLTDTNGTKECFGSHSLIMGGITYSLNQIYNEIDEIKAQLYQANKTLSDEEKLLLNIPIIQWQLGWYYGSAFYHRMLMKGEDMVADEGLENYLLSWDKYQQRLNEFHHYFLNSIKGNNINTGIINKDKDCDVLKLKHFESSLIIYALNDFKKLIKSGGLIKGGIVNIEDKEVSNFSTAGISFADYNCSNFDGYFAAFGSLSIKHRFQGVLVNLDDNFAELSVEKIGIYIKDGFDFQEEQELGLWNDNIFNCVAPSLNPIDLLSRKRVTNKKIDDFIKSKGIGREYSIYFVIDENKFINKVVYNRKTGEIKYE